MSVLSNSHPQSASANVEVNRRPRDQVPGYSAVLLQTGLKHRLWEFRRSQGLPCDGQAERCLASALFDLVLNDASLHERWMERFWAAMQADARIVRDSLAHPN